MRRYWQLAGVRQKISSHLRPALSTQLVDSGRSESFHFAFIDADKESSAAYYERSLQLLRRGGLVAIDNVLWGGSVADARDQKPSTLAIRALDEWLRSDERVTVSLVPSGDGLFLARKR